MESTNNEYFDNIPDFGNPEDEFYEPLINQNEDYEKHLEDEREAQQQGLSKDKEFYNNSSEDSYLNHIQEERFSQIRNSYIQQDLHANTPDISSSLQKNININTTEFLQTINENKRFEIMIEEHDSKEIVEVKSLLNNLLEDIPLPEVDTWEKVASQLSTDPLKSRMSSRKIYTIGLYKFLVHYKNLNKWQLSKNGYKFSIYNKSNWCEIEDTLIRKFIEIAALKLNIPELISLDSKFIKDVYEQLSLGMFFKHMSFPERNQINLQNGTLEISLNGIRLYPFNPNDFMTYRLDFSYNPHAVNTEWINFINDVLPDKNTQRTLQEALGYLLIHGLKLEKMIFLFGTGSNGKSVVNEVLNGLFGDNLITHYPLDILTNPKSYQRANIENKLINYCSDIKLDKIDPAELKILASGEKAQVRQIYQAPYIMTRYAKFIFNINRIDNANVESTVGFFRRMVFIPFDKTIPEERQDKFLHQRILQNKEGVLNWILKGSKQVIQNQEIFISQRCYDFLDNFMKESSLTVRFMEDSNLTASSCDDIIVFQTMYDKFVGFCKKQGEKPMKQRSFNKELKKLNIPFDRKNYGYVWFAKFLK